VQGWDYDAAASDLRASEIRKCKAKSLAIRTPKSHPSKNEGWATRGRLGIFRKRFSAQRANLMLSQYHFPGLLAAFGQHRLLT